MQVLGRHNIYLLPGVTNVACTKLHHFKATKELSGGGQEQAKGGQKGNWESDGKEGPNNPNKSMQILLNWMMSEGNYPKFCGKNNDGVSKILFCNSLSAKMSEETTATQDAKNVLTVNKIQHIAHTF